MWLRDGWGVEWLRDGRMVWLRVGWGMEWLRDGWKDGGNELGVAKGLMGWKSYIILVVFNNFVFFPIIHSEGYER